MEEHCGKCGYRLRGARTNICPECGADLTRVGRVEGRQLRLRRWDEWITVVVIVGMFALAAAWVYLRVGS